MNSARVDLYQGGAKSGAKRIYMRTDCNGMYWIVITFPVHTVTSPVYKQVMLHNVLYEGRLLDLVRNGE